MAECGATTGRADVRRCFATADLGVEQCEHGGQLVVGEDRLFIVPMLTSGGSGYQSVSVNVTEMQLATNSIASMPTTSLDKAAADVRDDAQRLVESAGSLDLYDNAEGTALLTAFTGLAVDCTKARYQPSWVQLSDLANH